MKQKPFALRQCCFVEACVKYKQNITSFHRFPTDADLCNRWCETIQILNNQQNAFTFPRNSYVCGHHFKKSDKYFSGRRVMLYKNVVPSIFPRRVDYDNRPMEITDTDSSISSSQDSSNDSFYSSSDNSDVIVKEEDPLVGKSKLIELCTISDDEDFHGFKADDLNKEIVNASTREGLVVSADTEVEMNVGHSHIDRANSENVDGDVVVLNNKVDPRNDDKGTDLSDAIESDDEIIFVENEVEVIEIDDDDEMPQATQIRADKKISNYDIQQMVIANHPQVELRKPKLDWKSDQFRLIYINGEKQNLCTCTKCYEIFEEISIDVVCRHARCNPTPCVLPCTKRRKMIDYQGTSNDSLGTSVRKLTISNIQTIAACMDVEASTFYQGKRFLHFAQFMIDTGASLASTASTNKFIFEPNDVLGTFRDQLRDSEMSKIASILNDPQIDYSLSCDVWEDNLRRKTNVSLDLHYVDTNFLRHRIFMGVRSVDAVTVNDVTICEQILEILFCYSKQNNGAEFLQKAVAFMTSRKFGTQSLGIACLPSPCSIINDIADEIVNADGLNISEKCLHIIAWLNGVCTEKITVFEASKWENIFELFKRFSEKKGSVIQQGEETTFPQDYSILELLQPFHNAINTLSESRNNITKVFGTFKLLESNLMPHACDKDIVKSLKSKALDKLRTAFADSDAYQICMFLDPSNRDLYNSLESDQMDSLQSKIDAMINPYMSTKENGCVENDLIDYMDDNVTSQQNQIDLFLQWLMPDKDDPYEFWQDIEQMPGLKTLARKYFSIPTYASLSECKFSADAKDFLGKRSRLEMKNMETMLIMNSSQFDVDRTNLS